MQAITPFLWFNGRAEEAVDFYMSIFKNSRIVRTARYLEGSPGPKGTVMTISFTLNGQEFVALNGGAQFSFTPAISFVVNCETQAEVDHYWEELSKGGQTHQCGWLQDKFGVSWQVVPPVLVEMLCDRDETRAQRTMAAMLKMTKLDIQVLKDAYDGA